MNNNKKTTKNSAAVLCGLCIKLFESILATVKKQRLFNNAYQANGCSRIMVSSLSGPVETIVTLTPTSSSRRLI